MCLFCDIVQGKIPCNKIYEDDSLVAFDDIHPQAPVHILVVPKSHKDSVLSFQKEDATLLIEIFSRINELVRQLGIQDKGFRIVINTGEHGGQTVGHVHFHVLGGRQMDWPPG